MVQRSTITWNGDQANEAIKAAVAKGLLIGAEHLLQVANDLVPLDEGPLMHSGNASVDGDKLEAAVSYDTHYAVEQHENLAIRHAPGRQAKYLEQPMASDTKTIAALIKQKVKRELA